MTLTDFWSLALRRPRSYVSVFSGAISVPDIGNFQDNIVSEELAGVTDRQRYRNLIAGINRPGNVTVEDNNCLFLDPDCRIHIDRDRELCTLASLCIDPDLGII